MWRPAECSLEDETYEDGAETQVECNRCVCACGNWVCTAMVCPGEWKRLIKRSNTIINEPVVPTVIYGMAGVPGFQGCNQVISWNYQVVLTFPFLSSKIKNTSLIIVHQNLVVALVDFIFLPTNQQKYSRNWSHCDPTQLIKRCRGEIMFIANGDMA